MNLSNVTILNENIKEELLKQAYDIHAEKLGEGYLDFHFFKELARQSKIFIAVQGQEVLGYITINSTTEKDFFIDKKVDLLGMDEEVLIINTCAVKYEREGVGSLLVGYVLKKHAKDYEKIYVPAWKHAGITNAGKLLEKFEFKPVFEIEKYWYEDSLNIKNFCPICDNPCLCSLVIYLRKKV